MKYDARFSVVLPLSSLSENRLNSFEEMCQRYMLAVDLPITLNRQGDMYIVSSRRSLRDAQVLRRRISALGFPADVVADENGEGEEVTAMSLNTLVVDADAFVANRPEDAGDIMSSAWESLELPAAGRQGHEKLVAHTPEMLVEEETARDSTKNISFMDLMKVVLDAEKTEQADGRHAAQKNVAHTRKTPQTDDLEVEIDLSTWGEEQCQKEKTLVTSEAFVRKLIQEDQKNIDKPEHASKTDSDQERREPLPQTSKTEKPLSEASPQKAHSEDNNASDTATGTHAEVSENPSSGTHGAEIKEAAAPTAKKEDAQTGQEQSSPKKAGDGIAHGCEKKGGNALHIMHICLLVLATIGVILACIHLFVVPLSFISALSAFTF